MKVSRRWLERYVDLSDRSAEQILLDLTMSTAEVEGVEAFGTGIDDVVVGHVVERVQHPDADKLSVTKVAVGSEAPQQIVCGARNVAAGQKVAVVLPGAVLPGGLQIGKAKLRGVESLGMICSEKELGLSDASEGILVLPDDAPVGARFVDVFGVVDDVFEIDNKSVNHRPDLWGHHGIARELAAILGRPLRPVCEPLELPADGRSLPVRIDDLTACPRYCGLVLEGVTARRSPPWLRWALAAVGQRSIDLLVDLTNFVMFDLGQPMHAFDLHRLSSEGIGVRFARAGETITTLDGVERRLSTDDLLITSGDEPVALAGVMGGAGSMVEAGTSELFLESANFRASIVRRTSTRLGLRSESSARFEKALDPAQTVTAVHRFVGLLQREVPGARAAGPLVDPAHWRYEGRSIRLRRARLALKLGIELPDARVRDILERLAFDVRDAADGFDVGVPSFRATKDVTIEDDLVEEVGRMFRYDNIPERPLVSVVEVPPRDPELELERRAVLLCAAELGAHEVYDYSFVPDATLERCGALGLDYVRVTNPVAPEITRIRRHVLPSLLASTAPSLRSAAEVRTFEVGKGYHPERRDADGLPHEVRELALVFARRDGEPCYPELRDGVETLLRRLGYPAVADRVLSDAPPWAHPQRCAELRRGERAVGFVGHLHPAVARALELPASTAIATVDLRALLATARREPRYQRISPYPPQPVDVALLVPHDVQVAAVDAFLRAVDTDLVQRVELFEVYTGEGIPGDRKSVNFTVTLGSMERTLSAKDEESYLSRVRQRCAEIGAELRG
ncbi:MAG: phenylalanine--tRNA ligase subunit beta [Planctomycetes bacterium]|nr:phenylalanine--tRNA ligase subunit beta [Planctomycetota bacterium]